MIEYLVVEMIGCTLAASPDGHAYTCRECGNVASRARTAAVKDLIDTHRDTYTKLIATHTERLSNPTIDHRPALT